jgi:hypothetical protein
MIVLWHAFRLFSAKLVIKVAEVTFLVCLPCTRGLLALAKRLVPEKYRGLMSGTDLPRRSAGQGTAEAVG